MRLTKQKGSVLSLVSFVFSTRRPSQIFQRRIQWVSVAVRPFMQGRWWQAAKSKKDCPMHGHLFFAPIFAKVNGRIAVAV